METYNHLVEKYIRRIGHTVDNLLSFAPTEHRLILPVYSIFI